jgi:hypothetical protein
LKTGQLLLETLADVPRKTSASPTLFEQVYPQQQGYALILLSIEAPEEDTEDDDSGWNRSSSRLLKKALAVDRRP